MNRHESTRICKRAAIPVNASRKQAGLGDDVLPRRTAPPTRACVRISPSHLSTCPGSSPGTVIVDDSAVVLEEAFCVAGLHSCPLIARAKQSHCADLAKR